MKVSEWSRALTLIAALSLACETATAGGLHYGPIAGMNFAGFSWEHQPYLLRDIKLGPAAGAYLALDLDPRMQLRTELWYSRKGTSATYSVVFSDSVTGLLTRNDYETEATLSYLEVPLTVHMVIHRGDNPLGALYAGPYLGWLVGGEMVTGVTATTTAYTLSRAYRLGRESFRGSDFGLTGGVTVYIRSFEINGRYSMGLRRTIDMRFEDINKFMDPLNRVWTITLGYQIR